MSSEANSDELAAFVTSTLRGIAAGIRGAQADQIQSAHRTGSSGFSSPKEVEFDIAVTAKSSGMAGGGFKISVFGIGANAEGESASENSSVSRIRFTVPTHFKQNRTGQDERSEDWKTV